MALDESDSDVHALMGLVSLIQDRYKQAIIEGEKSISLCPTNAQAHVLLAVSMNAVGRFNEAIELVKRAMRLHPYYLIDGNDIISSISRGFRKRNLPTESRRKSSCLINLDVSFNCFRWSEIGAHIVGNPFYHK